MSESKIHFSFEYRCVNNRFIDTILFQIVSSFINARIIFRLKKSNTISLYRIEYHCMNSFINIRSI